MSGGGGGENASLEYTPTWILALVCFVIIAISLVLERFLHYLGKYLKKKNQQPLFQALQKIKEELMLLGFISLLLTVTQNGITRICVSPRLVKNMLPCGLPGGTKAEEGESSEEDDHHGDDGHGSSANRHLLSASVSSNAGFCQAKGLVPLIATEALHHLHIFIFVLAVVHVTTSVLTVVFGGIRIRQWKRWEKSIAQENYDTQKVLEPKITHVHQHDFIRGRFRGLGKDSAMMGWLHSFLKQFYGSVTKSDYVTLRFGFIMTHCRSNLKFDFHKYMIRALEDDFKKVVGISWYLWIFVIIFLLLNVNGWNAYFWIYFIPFFLLLAVGTKLEHVITQLAHEVAEKHAAIEGDLVVQPSDDHFWFHRPRLVLHMIHFILFQNAFELAYFFWILVTYGFNSCIMGKMSYIFPRLLIGVFIQVVCSYSTLPLYAIVTQMGTRFKKVIFDEHVQAGLLGWAQKAKKKTESKGEASKQEQGSKSSPAGDQPGGSNFQKLSGPENSPPNP